MNETYNLNIITTCLRDCSCTEDKFVFHTSSELKSFLKDYLDIRSAGLFDKFLAAQRRFVKSYNSYPQTIKGIKIFYSVSGVRFYLWITIRRVLDTIYIVDDSKKVVL